MDVSSDFMERAARDDILNSGNYDFTISSYTSSVIGDPDDDLFGNYILDFASVTVIPSLSDRWEKEPEAFAEAERRIREQSVELDPVKRKEMVRELDLYLHNEVVQYPLVGWSLIFPGWRVELKGWKGYDLYSYTKAAMNERMWLADS